MVLNIRQEIVESDGEASSNNFARKKHPFVIFSILISLAVLYLSLIWKTTANIDRLTTDTLFWSVILWLLWRKKESLVFHSDPVSSFGGLVLLGLVLSKAITLYGFEANLLTLLPIFSAIALTLIASGIKGFGQYWQELFFTWFLFFPTGVIGNFIDRTIHITILNAKFATYFLYYLGFNTASEGNQIILSLPDLGKFKAIVDYPCAGVPMILLILKLAFLLIAVVALPKMQQILIPVFSLGLGFILGVIRVCILTLYIPHKTQFAYWHGHQGSQIFSTLAIVIFSGFCYWIVSRYELKSSID